MERVGRQSEACGPTTSQIIGPPGTGFSLSRCSSSFFYNYLVTTMFFVTIIPSIQKNVYYALSL